MFLDSASGLPLHPAARNTFLAALDQGWADPLRLYGESRQASMLLDNAREVVAGVLQCRADEVSFVGSGTTACHLAVLGLRRGRRRVGKAVVHSAVEHSSVLYAASWQDEVAAARGESPALSVGVDELGRVDMDAWSGAVASPGVALACLQAANHEVGTVQPVEAAAAVCRSNDVPLVVDAAAAIGWVDPPTAWDALAASAHKWGGPAGVGVLAVRKGTRWREPWPGDERERAMAGFVNVPAVLAAAAALQAVEAERRTAALHLAALTRRMRQGVVAAIPDVELAGDSDLRLPHIVNLSCLYVDGEALVSALDKAGFAVASGSACTSSALEPSHVLAAMGVLTHGNIRVSVAPSTFAVAGPESPSVPLSIGTSDADLERFVTTTAQIVARLRNSAGLPS